MKLLLVEDSALMRRVLRESFASERDIEIMFARDGEDALEKLEQFQPDVITMDINMPKMDGLTCLAHIMDRRKTPVIMLSSLTDKGTAATFEALELGAVDFVAKPDGTVSVDLSSVVDDLHQKVRSAYDASASRRTRAVRGFAANRNTQQASPAEARRLNLARPRTELLMIGSSTGGPGIVQNILEQMTGSFPLPILIAQHMPPKFTTTFAQRLDSSCPMDVIEVTEPMPLAAGKVYLAAGGKDVIVNRKFNRLMAEPATSDPRFPWHPSVSRMVMTALDKVDAKNLIGVMLTGMGDDGSTEMAQIHQRGGVTIAQSEDSSAVFGMPGKLIEKDGATAVLDAEDIPEQMKRWLGMVAPIRRSKC